MAAEQSTTTASVNVCYKHPTIETNLRCNKCGQYICAKCAVRTPVGYRCKTCVTQQQDVYFTAALRDYLIAAVLGLVMSVVIGFVLIQLLLLTILLALPAGGFISGVSHRLTGKRRGRYMGYVLAGAIVVGAVIASLPLISSTLPIQDPSEWQAFAPPLLYAVMCAAAAASRFRFAR